MLLLAQHHDISAAARTNQPTPCASPWTSSTGLLVWQSPHRIGLAGDAAGGLTRRLGIEIVAIGFTPAICKPFALQAAGVPGPAQSGHILRYPALVKTSATRPDHRWWSTNNFQSARVQLLVVYSCVLAARICRLRTSGAARRGTAQGPPTAGSRGWAPLAAARCRPARCCLRQRGTIRWEPPDQKGIVVMRTVLDMQRGMHNHVGRCQWVVSGCRFVLVVLQHQPERFVDPIKLVEQSESHLRCRRRWRTLGWGRRPRLQRQCPRSPPGRRWRTSARWCRTPVQRRQCRCTPLRHRRRSHQQGMQRCGTSSCKFCKTQHRSLQRCIHAKRALPFATYSAMTVL